MFSGRWEGGSAVTLSSFTAVNSRLSDVTEGEFIFITKKPLCDVVVNGKFSESSEHVKRQMFGHFPEIMSAMVAGGPSLRSFADVFFLFPFEKQQNKLKTLVHLYCPYKDRPLWLDGWRGSAGGGRGARGHGGGGEFSQRLTPAVLSAGEGVCGGSFAVQVR